MSRRKQPPVCSVRKPSRYAIGRTSKNKIAFREICDWFVPENELFNEDDFHGNSKWQPESLAVQALIWSWQESKNVTDAFDQSQEHCQKLGLKKTAQSYTSLMNGLSRYEKVFQTCLRKRFQDLAEEVGGRFWSDRPWVLIGLDGSRATTPRTVANEKAFCAPNYGHGKTAKYGKKKSRGLRRKRNKENQPQPQAPQVWITMMWHMQLRLPWTWRLGASNSSERGHVQEMLEQEEFPENTLFCGDAGFVGYPLWDSLLSAKHDFIVRVGANVNLLSERADVQRIGDGQVLCWPKGKMKSGAAPLRLRLVKVTVSKTKMWLLTSVLEKEKLSSKQLVRYYKLRWGIEVEFRGLKQTVDKQKLRCRNSQRVLVELDWSIRAMAVAELIALREQIPNRPERSSDQPLYDTKDRSLANTMRALRKCLRNLEDSPDPCDELFNQLARAKITKYNNRTDRQARYRPKNPDKNPLGKPFVRIMNAEEREKLKNINQKTAA